MKRWLSILLVSVLCLGVFFPSFADTTTTSSEIDKTNYVLKTLSFKTETEVVGLFKDKSSIDAQLKLKKENEKNIANAINFVKQMQFEQKGCIGLEKAMLDELAGLQNTGTYIKNFTIGVPKEKYGITTSGTTTPEYYGVYNGFTFQQYFTTYNDTYSRESYDVNKMNLWASRTINLALCFANATITVPYTILSSATQSDIKSYGSNHI
jgi:hypothetical protein